MQGFGIKFYAIALASRNCMLNLLLSQSFVDLIPSWGTPKIRGLILFMLNQSVSRIMILPIRILPDQAV